MISMSMTGREGWRFGCRTEEEGEEELDRGMFGKALMCLAAYSSVCFSSVVSIVFGH